MNRDEVKQILQKSIENLFQNDLILLTNNVSERSITHKLAEYLQHHVPKLNVDCEYNRNSPRGANCPKYLKLIREERNDQIGNKRVDEMLEEELEEYSTFPDIIIHKRGNNEQNLLVIEAKKKNSRVDDEFDFRKLRGFTGNSDENDYCYKHGVFMKFTTGVENPPLPLLTWFSNGKRDTE